ncbi:hypothetical protein Asppvi_000166 [Aspergillus pseudoviridinutans]|uniref:Uncharacterized protein n=1 Tax=Aspergillus pseudoviridinutans TaxID=1517512 RepID=A0A9P3EPJ7_9EURO|nr:uncharacterized protein Asppvi_000166 [Aspergillus pseudoviridinutans]GIJ81667.1 hypothetical protein Asppvi_000166 [Aspergillus pseudoviridinutans]
MAIGSLRENQVREIFKLGKDRVMDISIYKATIVPEAVKRSLNKVTRATGVGRPQVEPFAWTLVSLMLIEAICEQSGYNGDGDDDKRLDVRRTATHEDRVEWSE